MTLRVPTNADTVIGNRLVASADTAIEITSARDDPEGALADLLTALDTLGFITDSSTASGGTLD